MSGDETMIYRFEDFELDPARFELRRASVSQPIEPQVLSLLLLLASNPDRLVSKDEIIERIWNNRIVSEATLAARVKLARKALDDDGARQRLVRTVHGRGFRFVGDVSFVRQPSLHRAGTGAPPHSAGRSRPGRQAFHRGPPFPHGRRYRGERVHGRCAGG